MLPLISSPNRPPLRGEPSFKNPGGRVLKIFRAPKVLCAGFDPEADPLIGQQLGMPLSTSPAKHFVV
jgi:hypothetical protein